LILPKTSAWFTEVKHIITHNPQLELVQAPADSPLDMSQQANGQSSELRVELRREGAGEVVGEGELNLGIGLGRRQGLADARDRGVPIPDGSVTKCLVNKPAIPVQS
jgi:hypothetical protein